MATSRPSAHGSVVIIPARDEDGSVGGVVTDVLRRVRPALVIVVDDQSSDSTALEARKAGALVVSTPRHRAGLGAAMNIGIRIGRSLGFDTFLTIDADGQYDPADLLSILRLYRSSSADLVVGDRLANGRPEGMKQTRYSANRLFSTLFSSVLDLDGHTDSQSGIRAFGSRIADCCLVTNTFTYTQEQLLRARMQNLQVLSTPVSFYPRRHGQSRLVTSASDYARRTIPNLLQVYFRLTYAGGSFSRTATR